MIDFRHAALRFVDMHRNGAYTLLEVLPAIASCATPNDAPQLIEILPSDLQERFCNWVIDYPLDGGVIFSSSKPIPTETILALKAAVAHFQMKPDK